MSSIFQFYYTNFKLAVPNYYLGHCLDALQSPVFFICPAYFGLIRLAVPTIRFGLYIIFSSFITFFRFTISVSYFGNFLVSSSAYALKYPIRQPHCIVLFIGFLLLLYSLNFEMCLLVVSFVGVIILFKRVYYKNFTKSSYIIVEINRFNNDDAIFLISLHTLISRQYL